MGHGLVTPCGTGKRQYSNANAAERVAHKLNRLRCRRAARQQRTYEPFSVYRCGCGSHHIGRLPPQYPLPDPPHDDPTVRVRHNIHGRRAT